jgi:hypothetical protein
LDRERHSFRNAIRIIGERILKVGRDWQLCSFHDARCVRDRCLAADGAVAAPERRRKPATGSRECLESKPFEHLR